MAEEKQHLHMQRGHHETEEHKEHTRAMYWGLGLTAAGVVIAAVLLFQPKKSSSSQAPTVVNPSQPFIPNPTDVSIGSQAAPLFWPGLPTSGTPSEPRVHHHSHKSSNSSSGSSNKKTETSKKKSSSSKQKKIGTSPTGASHGHVVTHHTHNPVTHGGKGLANG